MSPSDPAYARSTAHTMPLHALYANHKGQVEERHIVPAFVWYGESPFHHGAQYLLRADEPSTGKVGRDFAMSGFLAIGAERIAQVWGPEARAEAMKQTAAVATLESAGFTYVGGAELWRPLLGKPPDFNALDNRQDLIDCLEAFGQHLSKEGQECNAALMRRAIRTLKAPHPLFSGPRHAGP